ncbi:MAG: glutathione S-transferase family protein [Hyphomicrobiales bacterium]|nr:glutathione S-transferase family protein [Hyphomicrobiales bacterium]
MELFIGNKKYSSWSFRPWIALRMKEIEFQENLWPFDMAGGNRHFEEFSPTGKVPCLVDDGITVWESLAILEYLHDKFPDYRFWPNDIQQRANARSVSNEMHGGFLDLRGECPMNMNRRVEALPISDGARKDVDRIVEIWDQCLNNSGGPFLFGEFTNADAMFAPVVNRFDIYRLSDADVVSRYSNAMTSTSPWHEWEEAGRTETWIVEEDEA